VHLPCTLPRQGGIENGIVSSLFSSVPVWRNGRRTGLKILSGVFSRGLFRFQDKFAFPRGYWHKSCFLAGGNLLLETSESGTISGTRKYPPLLYVVVVVVAPKIVFYPEAF
jgi:hypothetical protein